MSALDLTPLDQIAESDLQALVSNGASETVSLEFKETTYGSADDDKREFLKDVTALANTSGGHVIIGMAAVDGVATSLQPITTPSADQEKQRLENMLLAAVEPRLVGLQMREVPVTGGYVLVLRVPRSWNPPHRVTFKGLELNPIHLDHTLLRRTCADTRAG
ncbi:AlbA family DNA-binding domain-containing protein [Sediminicoccus sp. BL-A-41-H5]|uniref:AlbA family DNA-binding domain-containing protein n=1 Tax=Sediminicoccus sp. BL-A-41-H5 TaxID=3421106 RepID=UPI003D67B2F1